MRDGDHGGVGHWARIPASMRCADGRRGTEKNACIIVDEAQFSTKQEVSSSSISSTTTSPPRLGAARRLQRRPFPRKGVELLVMADKFSKEVKPGAAKRPRSTRCFDANGHVVKGVRRSSSARTTSTSAGAVDLHVGDLGPCRLQRSGQRRLMCCEILRRCSG